ncbi:MAG: UbiA family prenyltransferase, partial [Deltaproteobacteria bacterium]|nr:UbiA family prenyltransferase [Deltaproteobacteria bacterium]
ALRGRGERRLASFLFRVFRFLLKSNTLVALGGGGLALAGGLAQGLEPSLSLVAVPFFYLYTGHILNHFLDRRAAAYNDPDRARFYIKHRFYLVTTAVLAACLGLFQSARLGTVPFWSFAVLAGLGLVYPIRLVPARWEHLVRYTKLKDFPGSKPLSIGLAWGAVCALWPSLSFANTLSLAGGGLFVLIGTLAFARAALFDVLDIQGDLVVGKETLAISLGEDRSSSLLKALSAGIVVLAAAATALGWLGPAGLVLGLAPVSLGAVIVAYQKRKLLPGIFLEGLVEASLLLAGALALLIVALR